MKFIIEMNVHELSRTIKAGTLDALVSDVKAYEMEVAGTKTPKATQSETKQETPKSEPKPKKKVKTEESKTKSKYTREDVRGAFVAKNSPSTRDKLKAILDKYNTPNISGLKEEHFEDVMKDLEGLE